MSVEAGILDTDILASRSRQRAFTFEPYMRSPTALIPHHPESPRYAPYYRAPTSLASSSRPPSATAPSFPSPLRDFFPGTLDLTDSTDGSEHSAQIGTPVSPRPLFPFFLCSLRSVESVKSSVDGKKSSRGGGNEGAVAEGASDDDAVEVGAR